MPTTTRVVVIGAGVAGLVAAVELAAQGLEVTVVERSDAPGGKMREVEIDGARLDVGPTVFTMRWVFEEIFADVGASLADRVRLRPVEVLARHAWSEHERLDLFADVDRSADAIGALAGAAEAQRYRSFCDHARRVYETLEEPFIRTQQAGLSGLVRKVGIGGLGDLCQIKPFTSLWRALGRHFEDPRLRQLFGRYTTYCGSSPFLAPATLMLVAHVEQEGVWLVEGGMHRLAEALARLGAERGVVVRYRADVTAIRVEGGRSVGVQLATGERLDADAVVVNADVAAVAAGRFGSAVARAVPDVPRQARSLSAMTWALLTETRGFPLIRHNVFFSADYAREFDDIFKRSQVPAHPTVYVCAQDRTDRDRTGQDQPDQDRTADEGSGPATGAERLLCLINAPPIGDVHSFEAAEIEQCANRAFGQLQRCGLHLEPSEDRAVVTTPTDFARLYPATGGALYGQATHGWRASFRRPGACSRIPGVYLAGGSAHPGPGVPMAALSGRQAAARLLADLGSTGRSRPAAMPGGTSTG